jgi:hypothetical protein
MNFVEAKNTNSGVPLGDLLNLQRRASADRIFLVHEGYMPLVLRQTNSDEKRAKLVGVCHVTGIEDVHRGNDWEPWLLE